MPRLQPVTNCNSLTLAEFLHAVGKHPVRDAGLLEMAWSKGEDPTDWRHHYAAQKGSQAAR